MDLINQIDLFIFSLIDSLNLSSVYFLSFFSYYYFYIYFLAFCFYIYFFEKKWEVFRLLVILSLLGFSSIYLLKYTVKKERFENSFVQKLDFSFPSSHAYFGMLIILFSLYKLKNLWIRIVSILFSIFSIFSLIVLKVHYFSDIIFSIFLSSLFFYFISNQKILSNIKKKLLTIGRTILKD